VVVLGAGSFGVVVRAELRGSAVALKALHANGKTNRNKWAATMDSAETAAPFSRNPKGVGLFSFIDTAFSQVEDEERRALLRLQRALQQASCKVRQAEEAQRDERVGVASVQ
jgi:hypothetical protein